MKRLDAFVLVVLLGCIGASSGCGGGRGSGFPSRDPRTFEPPAPQEPSVVARRVKRITEPQPRAPQPSPEEAGAEPEGGTALGTFRNTYYNFPSELDYDGPSVALFDRRCRPLARVPRAFHDTLCVQGSGSLASGRTVSFARRACECARTCPRTGQKICFDPLDPQRFPWGRGAAGTAITPLRSVAVDAALIALGTPLFIPDFVGLPLDEASAAKHDGCFVAEDRGIKVVGQHVDVFTGRVAVTRLWNKLVPTNRGVRVFVDDPRCPPRRDLHAP